MLPRTAFRSNVRTDIAIGTNISMGWVDFNMSYFDSDWFANTRTLFSMGGMSDVWIDTTSSEVRFTTPFDDGSQYGNQTYVTLVVEYTKSN